MDRAEKLTRYIKNEGLFAASYFERVLKERATPRARQMPPNARELLKELSVMWRRQRGLFMQDSRAQGVKLLHTYEGLPAHFQPIFGVAEAAIENGFVRPVCESILGYAVTQNRSLHVSPAFAAERESKAPPRPDLVLFPNATARNQAEQDADAKLTGGAADGVSFCKEAHFILDAKRFENGVVSDEVAGGQRVGPDRTATEDVNQVDAYLQGYEKTWGILTNGRSWRLMHAKRHNHYLRFDLVLFLEELGDKEPDDDDLAVFGLFWNFFGQPAVGSGYLDAVLSESEASTRAVRQVLRDQAHEAVQEIAHGFWSYAPNNSKGLTTAPTLPSQAELDHLREVSLTFLYRLLFILKAEAQGLLRIYDDKGSESVYGADYSTLALYKRLAKRDKTRRQTHAKVYGDLAELFNAIDVGNSHLGVPAYNGGLFDKEKHPEFAEWKLLDESLFTILDRLIYLKGNTNSPVPYADLDVRDLGDMYEGLLEQRLIAIPSDPPSLQLKNQKGERKASGSYFTPDGLVDHLVRKTLRPLLDKAGSDPNKVLSIRVLDPAMGSGHFLVKVVDIIADHLTLVCDPEDPEAPRDNGPAERAYWKRKVVESCVYGVDYNPMAVELARVSLWLYTAEYGKPLSFLDHHLKVGTSLVGANIDRLANPGLISKNKRKGVVWEPVQVVEEPELSTVESPKKKRSRRKSNVLDGQLSLGFSIDTNMLSGILKSIHEIIARPSDSAEDVKQKSKDYADAVGEELAAHRLLADLWCLQWFLGDPDNESIHAYEHPDGLYAQVKKICGMRDAEKRKAALEALQNEDLVKRIHEARNKGYGPRPEAYFHYELEFPEVAFDEQGKPRGGFGFDVVVGNPPWDRIRPERRQFYGPWGRPEQGREWDLANTQAASLEALISKLQKEHPELSQGWLDYEQGITLLNGFLRNSGQYQHQVVRVDGKKTGGDPDTFRYFTERMSAALRPKGRMGIVVPGTLWQAEGCTGLRRLLLSEMTVEELYVFENFRKWAFHIHSSFKFTTFIAEAMPPPPQHSFPAAFMLRDLQALHGKLPERVIQFSNSMAEILSLGTLALLDLQSDEDAQLIGRLHKAFPGLGDDKSTWEVRYRTELHMTNDAWRFKDREWMKRHGFLQVRPQRNDDGTWRQVHSHGSHTANYPEDLPEGGEYWVAPHAEWFKHRGYIELESVDGQRHFVHPDEAKEEPIKKVPAQDRYVITSGGIYTALYEGRMVHNFDHAQKGYLTGEGRRAIWNDIPIDDKSLGPRMFARGPEGFKCRIGFCDVTGATNERSMLACLLGKELLAGNTVPTLDSDSLSTLSLLAVLNSLVWDSLARLRVSLHLNWNIVSRVPVPPPSVLTNNRKLHEAVAKLSCTTPELADVWNTIFPNDPWTYASAERDPYKRAEHRAYLDAVVANAYGLSVPEYARILTGFPLLDRGQSSLEGDFFVTESNRKEGGLEFKPRSFITRDLALLRYMELKSYARPRDLEVFYRDEVGLDPNGPLSRFRIGEHRDLIDRVALARAQGAVAYIPGTQSGDGSTEEDERAVEAESVA